MGSNESSIWLGLTDGDNFEQVKPTITLCVNWNAWSKIRKWSRRTSACLKSPLSNKALSYTVARDELIRFINQRKGSFTRHGGGPFRRRRKRPLSPEGAHRIRTLAASKANYSPPQKKKKTWQVRPIPAQNFKLLNISFPLFSQQEGTFVWTTQTGATELAFDNFDDGEPNNYSYLGEEDCVEAMVRKKFSNTYFYLPAWHLTLFYFFLETLDASLWPGGGV